MCANLLGSEEHQVRGGEATPGGRGGGDSGQTPQSLGLCCVYIKLFYKLVGAFLTADGPTAAVEPERRRALHILASLCCFNYQSAAQRQEARCRDERLRLLSLPELCLMKGKRGPPTLPEGKDPRLRGLSGGNIGRASFFRRRCPSVRCQLSPGGGSRRHNLFIYHIRDLARRP